MVAMTKKTYSFKVGTKAAFAEYGIPFNKEFFDFLVDFARQDGAPGGCCSRCGGVGYRSDNGWGAHGGACFKCGGSGYFPFSLSKARIKKAAKLWGSR